MLPIQAELYQELPPVYGSKDFRELKAMLERVDEIIIQSGLEHSFVEYFPYAKRQTQKQRNRLV
ncbi:MAG: hypothetical protein KAH38_11270, partial [Candidatus Hydrogenedentes bacterium]|nr:hypothetical protein [Candidatus Hydrogenedentota bacterium]